MHDGSENTTDALQLIAIARNKESVPFELYIAIVPVNDQKPVIVTNTGLQIWFGGRANIRAVDLSKATFGSNKAKRSNDFPISYTISSGPGL